MSFAEYSWNFSCRYFILIFEGRLTNIFIAKVYFKTPCFFIAINFISITRKRTSSPFCIHRYIFYFFLFLLRHFTQREVQMMSIINLKDVSRNSDERESDANLLAYRLSAKSDIKCFIIGMNNTAQKYRSTYTQSSSQFAAFLLHLELYSRGIYWSRWE